MKERQAELKDRLQQALNIREMRAADLCERTGVPKGAVSYYLAGKSQPKADRLHLIAKALDVSEAWLLGFDVPMDRTPAQKENDLLAKLVVKMRMDAEFRALVAQLSVLDQEDLESVKRIVSAFAK